MLCKDHQKTAIGTCQWCGKLLCKHCIGKTMAKKVFCMACSNDLSPFIQTLQLKKMKEEKEKQQRKLQYRKIIEGY
ncbi:hypothetical protein HYS48_02410 [Candidatus Woesearchaeota archaeon]|nr:hypothetical protein [Candidatus Woesearchaeota archaeon]